MRELIEGPIRLDARSGRGRDSDPSRGPSLSLQYLSGRRFPRKIAEITGANNTVGIAPGLWGCRTGYSAPAKGKDGTYHGRVSSFRAVSEGKRAAEEIRRLNEFKVGARSVPCS
jgi:hypothetical protein